MHHPGSAKNISTRANHGRCVWKNFVTGSARRPCHSSAIEIWGYWRVQKILGYNGRSWKDQGHKKAYFSPFRYYILQTFWKEIVTTYMSNLSVPKFEMTWQVINWLWNSLLKQKKITTRSKQLLSCLIFIWLYLSRLLNIVFNMIFNAVSIKHSMFLIELICKTLFKSSCMFETS